MESDSEIAPRPKRTAVMPAGPPAISLSIPSDRQQPSVFLYRLPQNWSVDASFSMAKVKSKLEANTSGAIRRTTIDFKPTAW